MTESDSLVSLRLNIRIFGQRRLQSFVSFEMYQKSTSQNPSCMYDMCRSSKQISYNSPTTFIRFPLKLACGIIAIDVRFFSVQEQLSVHSATNTSASAVRFSTSDLSSRCALIEVSHRGELTRDTYCHLFGVLEVRRSICANANILTCVDRRIRKCAHWSTVRDFPSWTLVRHCYPL